MTRDAAGEEQVVPAAVVVFVGSLLTVNACRLVGNVMGVRDGLGAQEVHLQLEDIMPVGAKVKQETAFDVDEVRVNGIVGLAGVGLHADGTVVCPGAELHRRRSRKPDGRGLRAEGRDGVVYIVLPPDMMHVGSLSCQIWHGLYSDCLPIGRFVLHSLDWSHSAVQSPVPSTVH